MTDPRYARLAELLVHYSCELEAGETVLIEVIDVPHAFTRVLVRTASAAGVHPLVFLKNQSVLRELILGATEEQMSLWSSTEETAMAGADAYIGVRGSVNVSEMSDVPSEQMELYESTVWKNVHLELRVPQKRWVVLRWPSASMAQMAHMSTEAFEEFFFRVCTMDYEQMSRALVPLRDLMEKTDRVRIVAPGTDLTFSIKDIPAVPCDGRRNIPDGEVYTAPVRDSVNGTISYNAPTIYRGVTHENVRLEFQNGKIAAATSSNSAHLNEVLDSDEGARFVGEFAIGFNPHITEPMKDILFDEKIAGSIHFTPGAAYEEAFNGNKSQIHWDLVLMMDPGNGGGEIWFDDTLIRKDGLFVLEDLLGLNPDALR